MRLVSRLFIVIRIPRKGIRAFGGCPLPPEPVSQPYTPPQDKYSGADKAKYTTRAGIEGATLGLGDIVAGGTNVLASDLAQVTDGQSFGDRVKSAGRLLTTLNPVNAPISAIQTLRRPEFKEGRREFITEQEEFAKSHPYMNIGGELIGGLLTGGLGGGGKAIASQAGKQGIKALAKEGARQGAIYGGLYGAGSGLTEEADKLSAENALKGGASGAVGGAVLGAALPAAAVGGTRAAQAFLGTRGYAQRAANEIIQEAGGKEIGQIVRSDKGTRALKAAIKADDNVARVVRETADNQIINSAEKTKDIINKALGVDDIVNARNEARALYDSAVNQSTKQFPSDIYNNKATQEALSKAIAEDYSGELSSKGPNSLAVAQRAKEKLDDMIAASYEVGNYGVQKATSKTRDLMKVRNAFVKKIDELAPEYKLAREQFAKSIKPYEILEGLTQESGRERANTIKSILTNENKKAITDVFGKEKANQLFSELRAQSIENDRFNKLYNAAETKLTKEQPQAQGLIREALESAGSIVGNVVDVARFGGARRGRRQIGEILLGIEKERNTPSISNIIANKIKEKGGYSMKPLDKTVNSLGEPIAKTEEGVKNFNKWFKGSKVVDENGKPLVVYHGTEANFDAFDMSKGRANMDIQGAFFSPWELDAKGYGRNIKPVYLDIKNPADEATGYKALKKFQGQNNAGKKAKEYLKSLGYDGVINNNEEYIAFEPTQIKSVKNQGTFDPKNPNIYKSLIGGLGISQILKNKEGKINGI